MMFGRAKKDGTPHEQTAPHEANPLPLGPDRAKRVKIRLIRYNQKDLEEKEPKTIEECFRRFDREMVTWINIDGLLEENTIEKVTAHFDIHPLVLEDMLNADQRPKTDDYGNYLFMVLKALGYDKKAGEFVAEQISLVLGSDYVLSLRERESDGFDTVMELLRKSKGHIRQAGSDHLAYALIDAVVNSYFGFFEKIGEKIEDVEEELVVEPTPKTLQDIHKLKRRFASLRKSVRPLREVVAGLEQVDSSRITQSTQMYLRDVYDHIVQALETIEDYRDTISGMLDIYLSSVGNKLNEVMKVLTIIATLFIPITFLIGVFGMNFKEIPVLGLPFPFPGSLVLMAGVAAVVLLYFRKKGWL
jgi:magnesium transporter